MTHDFKAEAEKEAEEQVHPASDINRAWFIVGYEAGAARGVEVGEDERARLRTRLDTMERIAKHRVESIDKMLTAIREFIPLFDEHGRTGKTPEGYYEAWKELSERAERARDYFSKRGAR